MIQQLYSMKPKIIFGMFAAILILSIVNSGYIIATNIDILEGGPAEWEKYVLDEGANKDKLYCRVTKDSMGNAIETRWYSYFVNPNELIRTDIGDTRTPNCESPNFTPVYAKGSNKDKIYSRVIMDNEGNILETVWYNACTEEEIKRDKGDATYSGSGSFTGKCYHPDFTIDEEGKIEEASKTAEKGIMQIPIINFGQKIVNWFKSLFGQKWQ